MIVLITVNFLTTLVATDQQIKISSEQNNVSSLKFTNKAGFNLTVASAYTY